MRTLTLLRYSELSESAKATAIKEVREDIEEDQAQDAYYWAIDDCSLFEPPHAEMVALLGEDYYDRNTHNGYGQFVFKNNRKGIEFDLDYFETVQIAKALEITNHKMFKTWLGIPEIFHYIGIEILDHNGSTVIEIENPFMSEDPRQSVMNSIIDAATEKFEAHMDQIGKRIVRGIEEYFSDENIEQKIEDGLDYEFAEEGHIVNI
jgi:hypothetical protein